MPDVNIIQDDAGITYDWNVSTTWNFVPTYNMLMNGWFDWDWETYDGDGNPIDVTDLVNIHDSDDASMYSFLGISSSDTSTKISTITLTITFSKAYYIDRISPILHCAIIAGTSTYTISAYYGGAWHVVTSGSGGTLPPAYETTSINVNADNLGLESVTKLKIVFNSTSDYVAGEGNYSWMGVKELYAYGNVAGPEVTTGASTEITPISATLNGEIIDTGGVVCDEVGFDYGEGITYGSSITYTGTFGVGVFSIPILNLSPDVVYHFRAKAHNTHGWGHGEDTTLVYISPSISVIGDPSDHSGVIIDSNQDGKLKVWGFTVAIQGAHHSCPLYYPGGAPHGTTTITARALKSFCNGSRIITSGSIAGCGAIIQSPDRKVYVEA